MTSQRARVIHSNGGEQEDLSFLQALDFDTKEPALNIKDLLPLSTPSTLPSPRPIVSEKSNASLRRTVTTNHDTSYAKLKAAPKMAATKAQSQCLELCHKTTASINLTAVRILEVLTTAKQLEYGFEPLAHDFLDTCQILFSIEAGLGECNRTGQKLPNELISELDHKFRVAHADFQILNQMLAKLLAPTNRFVRGLGKLFGDTDIKKISIALAKTRESLRMSALVFQWSVGNEKIEKEKGIGYTALAAALDRGADNKTEVATNAKEPSQEPPQQQQQLHSPSQVPQLSAPPPLSSSTFQFGTMDVQAGSQQPPVPYQHQYQQQQPQPQRYQQQPVQWSARGSSIAHEGSIERASANESYAQLSPWLHTASSSPNFRQSGGNTTLHPESTGLGTVSPYERYDGHSAIDDARSVTNITEPDSLHEDFGALGLDPAKVVRVNADPSSMPRLYPQNPVEGDTSSMKYTLFSAVRGKNHELIEQLLHRGAPANTGPKLHSLNEAILVRDEDSIRLLLLFGADPNLPDGSGVTPLLSSVEKSFPAAAMILLKYGADPNLVAGSDAESPLAVAVMANMVGCTQLLLTYNGDANHLTSTGVPLLTSAINKKTPAKFMDLLLNYGSNPNTKSREGKTALFEALQLGRADIVTSLLEHGADPNLPGPKHMLWPSTFYPVCLQLLLSHGADHKKCPGIMELAVSVNNIESVRLLLKAGVNPDLKKDGIYTPLCTAIRDNRPELLKLLLSNGADPNVMASEYPAFKCLTHDRIHFLPSLVAAGANLHSPKGILETAVSSNSMEGLKWLLDQGLNPNDRTPKGMSPLTTAIREKHFDMVDLLLLRGADPHMRGEDWPLCMAVRNPPILRRLLSVVSQPQAFKGIMEMAVSANQLESVKYLIAAGVSVEDKNGGVFSPLTTAIREDRREIVVYLLNGGGADVNAPGEHLPIVKALRRYHGEGDTEIMEMLLDHGADPNKIYRGWNGIMQAVENGDEDILRYISKKAGADLDIKDEMGRTVVEMAASRGWDEAVQILTEGDIKLRLRR